MVSTADFGSASYRSNRYTPTMKTKKQFFVLNWDFNSDRIYEYDVLPYLRNCIEERKEKAKRAEKSKRMQKMKDEYPEDFEKYYAFPADFERFRRFVDAAARYQFWGRCEYEMICHGWPAGKNDYKIDIYEQIKMNLSIIAEILWEEIKK